MALRTYSILSDYNINVHKSEALNINLPTETLRNLQQNFAFSWARNKVKYLGVYLTPLLSEVLTENFSPALPL